MATWTDTTKNSSSFSGVSKNTSTFTDQVKRFLAYFLATESDLYITTESGLLLVVGDDNNYVNQNKN